MAPPDRGLGQASQARQAEPRPADDDHSELCRDDIQPLGDILADPVQVMPAGAVPALRLDDLLDALQMPGPRAAVDPPLRPRARRASLTVGLRLHRGNGRLHILEQQLQLVGRKPLGAPAIQRPPEFGQKRLHPLGPLVTRAGPLRLRLRPALPLRCQALGCPTGLSLGQQHCLQGGDVLGQMALGDLLQAEIADERARSVKYQMIVAKLPLAKEVSDFEFAGSPVNESLVCELATGSFLAGGRNAVLVGGTGTGRIHLAIHRPGLHSRGARARFFKVVYFVNQL